jgi:hypothetical protein
MEKPSIKKVLLNSERKFLLRVISALLHLKNIVDKRIQVLYNKELEENSNKKDT